MLKRLVAWVRRHPIWSVLLIVIAALILYSVLKPSKPTYEYITQAVDQGDVVRNVTASGKLRALNTIKVGSEVSGQITRVFVDYNSTVRAGQVLALIDPTRLGARVQQSQAQVSLARASLAQAQAAVVRARTDLTLQEREFARRLELTRRGFVSKSTLDGSSGQLAGARAAVKTAEAQVQSALAQISQSNAELSSTQLDLSRTRIIAPASGVIINKLVEPGTTVAASFQTPNLFEIAADTTRMQVEASVDEADIGQVIEGQKVSFTVDSYPGQTFPAIVRQIRKAATETQNVVSYLVILDVENPDGRLLPGMTANVEIVTGEKRQAARIPSSVLRFIPRKEDRPEGKAPKPKQGEAIVYVKSADAYKPTRRLVSVGLAGEDYVEILSGLRPGEKILVRSKSLVKKTPASADNADSEDEEGDDNSAS